MCQKQLADEHRPPESAPLCRKCRKFRIWTSLGQSLDKRCYHCFVKASKMADECPYCHPEFLADFLASEAAIEGSGKSGETDLPFGKFLQ
jgi:hypothetical protein